MTDNFTTLGLAEPILRAIAHEGYTTPTPIQTRAIPHLLAGRDLLGIAQTGTGKTAAFALPILHRLAKSGGRALPGHCRVLVLAPTRELATQIADSFKAYGRHVGISVAVVIGGASYGPQTKALARGVDVLVATPGRLLDHIEARVVRLDKTEVVVLDEADHMLDLGFLVPIRRILKHLPAQRQSLFFSATMPKEIRALADQMLRDPVEVAIVPLATTVASVTQQVFLIEADKKRQLLVELLGQPNFTRTLVFTRTKRGADRVVAHLEAAGLAAAAIHGNKSQGQREKALAGFKSGRTRVLVATDIAARGIDVDNVTHVVNFELPHVPETYVHRIGRTARAGAAGIAISFCDGEEQTLLRDIERLTRQTLPSVDRRTSGWKTPSAGAKPANHRSGRGAPGRGSNRWSNQRSNQRSGPRTVNAGRYAAA